MRINVKRNIFVQRDRSSLYNLEVKVGMVNPIIGQKNGAVNVARKIVWCGIRRKMGDQLSSREIVLRARYGKANLNTIQSFFGGGGILENRKKSGKDITLKHDSTSQERYERSL